MREDGKRSGVAGIAVAFAVVVVVTAAAVGVNSITASNRTSSTSSANPCNFPPYLSDLASQVVVNQRFTSQQHGLSYVLAYGDNESGTTGQVNGKPYSTPPDTALTFYSYGAKPFNACPNNFPSSSIVGVLWIHVPLSPNGSYNISNMSVYFTPGLFTNSTSTA